VLDIAERRAACAMSPASWTGKRATYRSQTATVGLGDPCLTGRVAAARVAASVAKITPQGTVWRCSLE
jgi:hypothetical protein